MKRTRCLECGAAGRAARDWPAADLCGAVCRRAAGYELRRAQVLLTRAQRREQDAALRVSTVELWEVKGAERVLAFWRGEVARLRGELRALLAGASEADDLPTVAAPSPPAVAI